MTAHPPAQYDLVSVGFGDAFMNCTNVPARPGLQIRVSIHELWNCLPLLIFLLPSIGNRPLNAQATSVPTADMFSGKPRVAIISDIGNEPDDQMSFVRLLVYSNELDLEAMIAATSTWQRAATHPETMHALIQAYGQVRSNLLMHAKGWPTAEELD